MKIDYPCRKSSEASGRRRGINKFLSAAWRIVECPVFHVSLAALHDQATNSAIPTCLIRGRVGLWKVKIGFRQLKLFANPTETEFAISVFERERMGAGNFFAVYQPLVHPPKMGGAQVQLQFVNDPGNQREVLRWADGSANTGGVIIRTLPPGSDVLQRFSQVEVFKRVIKHHLEARS